MSNDASHRADSAVIDEPEPVEAEFEPAGGATPPPRRVPRKRSRYVGYRELVAASLLSGSLGAAGGAAVAIVAAGSNSGASTGTLAQQIATLSAAQDALIARAAQTASDVVDLRGRVSGQAEALATQAGVDASLRLELEALDGQLNALAGLGAGAPVSGAMTSDSPLGVLLARLNRVETTLAADAASPATARQMQRAVADLTSRVSGLAGEQGRLTLALNRRQLALDTLETGLEAAQLELAGLRARVENVTPGRAMMASFVAPEGSRIIRALAALETAAASGQPFLSQQRTLAALLPSDPDIVALEDAARNGAPSLDSLRADFTSTAQIAERLAGSPRWGWLSRSLAATVSDRGETALAAPAPHLIAARTALESGDVAAALAAIDRLDGTAAALFAGWRTRAAVRAGLDMSLQTLALRLSATNASGPAPVASEG